MKNKEDIMKKNKENLIPGNNAGCVRRKEA